jgi:flagellar biosynthesis/type III secretory pathway protein FliH
MKNQIQLYREATASLLDKSLAQLKSFDGTIEKAYNDGYGEGYAQGYQLGHEEGYEEGYNQGVNSSTEQFNRMSFNIQCPSCARVFQIQPHMQLNDEP